MLLLVCSNRPGAAEPCVSYGLVNSYIRLEGHPLRPKTRAETKACPPPPKPPRWVRENIFEPPFGKVGRNDWASVIGPVGKKGPVLSGTRGQWLRHARHEYTTHPQAPRSFVYASLECRCDHEAVVAPNAIPSGYLRPPPFGRNTAGSSSSSSSSAWCVSFLFPVNASLDSYAFVRPPLQYTQILKQEEEKVWN